MTQTLPPGVAAETMEQLNAVAAEFYIREMAFVQFEDRRDSEAHKAVLEAYTDANRAAAAQWRRLGVVQWRGLTRALKMLGAVAAKVGEAA